MKHCKHYLLFLLAGALLVLPVTYQYPISMDEVKNSITQFFSFNEETLKKAIPATIIALVVASGLYYLWKNRGITKFTTFEIEGHQVTQFSVYSQFNSDGGGAASCGYHTLLRGMQVIQAKNQNESNAVLEQTLKSPNSIANYFGPNGIWRKVILEKRGENDEDHGDWLWGNELEFLWNKQEKLDISGTINCGFTAVDDINLVNKISKEWYRDENDELKEREVSADIIIPPVKEALTKAFNSKERYFHLFAMSTMQQEGDSPVEQKRGHWFALVLDQQADGSREYFVTDSMNVLRDNDIRVVKLIKAIEAPVEIKKEEI